MAWSWIRSGEELLALSKEGAYASIAQGMRRRVDYWKTHFTDWPDRKTGWMHNYVCPVCTGFLTYDPDKPEEHRCPACGIAVENTKLVLEAWMYMRRFEIATTLVDAAILYVLEGDETDAAFVTRVVDFYADHYLEFEEYGINAGRGRIMGQSLDEAVWATNALKALMTIGFDGKSDRGQRWHQRLFLPISRLVVAQTSMIHNIPLWHASCAFCAGLFFGDERLVTTTVSGELGLRNQILKGFTEDSVWFENSTGYHYYAMNAATTACLFARWAGKQDQYVDLFDRVAGAYTALYKLRFRDRTMTAFNDSSRRDGVNGVKIHLN
nr:heparinase II/III family protein [Clostridia bacterium]